MVILECSNLILFLIRLFVNKIRFFKIVFLIVISNKCKCLWGIDYIKKLFLINNYFFNVFIFLRY